MKGKNIETRILAIVLSVLMLVIGMPLDAQAQQPANYDFEHQAKGGKWVTGEEDYNEGDYVPHRVVYDSNNIYNLLEVKLKYIDKGVIGFDEATGWYIEPTTATSPAAIYYEGNDTFKVTGPNLNANNELEYSVNLTQGLVDILRASKIDWAIYFSAHLSETGAVNKYAGGAIEKGSGHFSGVIQSRVKFGTGDKSLNHKAKPIITASIEIIKTVSPLSLPEPGGEFTYTFVVKNTGNASVKLTEVRDDKLGLITLPADVDLGPNESTAPMTIKVNHTAVGVYNNTVTAKAKYDKNNEVTATDSASAKVTDVLPSITVTKTASPTNLPKGGGVFTYNFVVTNTGTVPVTLTSVVDNVIGAISLPSVLVIPAGASSAEMTATYTHNGVGVYTNTVTATAKDEQGNNAQATAQATVEVLESDSSINVTKTASPKTLPEPGGEFTYTYIVTNNGKIDVTIDSVNDNVIGSIPLPQQKTLKSGEFMTLTGKYTYTDNGTYTNTVTVTATDIYQKTLTAATSATVTVTDTLPIISITKTATPTTLPEPGGEFTYKFVVTNTGTVPVTLTRVVDNVLGEIKLPEDVVLSPGESSAEMTKTFTHNKVGIYPNTVTATAVDDDENVTIATADTSVEVTKAYIPEYKLEITKEADVTEYDAVNDVIKYTIKVRNAGNARLTEVTVSDSLLDDLTGPTGDVGEDGALDINETWTYTGSYTIVREDIDRGFVKNTAEADSKETEPVTDSVTVGYDEPSNPPTDNSRYKLTIDKDADVKEYSAAGDVINYTITIENTGNRVLTGIKVTDPMLGELTGPEGDTNKDNKLGLDEMWIYKGEYTVTEEDMEKNSITNIAEAESNETRPVEDSVTVNRVEEESEIITDADIPGGMPEVPEEIVEPEVPQGTLPDTGSILNTTIIAAIGLMLIIAGMFIDKMKFIKG